jgi:cytochrome c oxidase subunit 3
MELPLVFVGIMTFILIMSSVTMVLAVEAGHRMDQKAVEKWMLWTIVGGVTFLSCQAWEWTHFIVGTGTPTLVKDFVDGQWVTKEVFGANLHANQYGPQPFADFFFFITGFHGFHVFSGVLLNFLIYYNTVTGVYQRRGHYEMVEKVGLYWHFVDLVWVFVFTFFYLV